MVEEINWGAIIVQTLCFWIMFKLGQASIIHRLGKDLEKLMEDRGIELEKDEDGVLSIKKKETLLKIERVDSQYFAYTTAGQFLAQGTDFRGLFESIKERYPDQNFKLEDYRAQFTEEESTKLVSSIFEVFGNKEHKDGESRK